MARLALAFLVSFGLGTTTACHSTQSAPAPVGGPIDAAVTAAPLDPTDPASLSRAAEDFAQIDPALTFASGDSVVVAWTSLRPHAPSVVRVRFSRDAGATWEGTQTVTSPDGQSAAQPALTSDSAGNVYLAWLGRHELEDGGIESSHIYVARAAASATSFAAPIEVSDEMHHSARVHKPSLAVTGAGTVIITWSYEHKNGDGVGVAHTTDGQKWTRGVVIERIDLGAKLPYVCASSHGDRAWVTYLDTDNESEPGHVSPGGAEVRLRASDDGGDSWAPARVATVSLPGDRKLIAMQSPLCAGEGDGVTVTFARNRPSDAGTPLAASSIVVARSIDGGRTFDVRHAYDAGSQLVLDPQMAREPDGAMDVAFYSSGADRPGHGADAPAGAAPEGASLRWFRVEDRGLSVSRVGRERLRFEPSPTEPAWPGEHFGLTWHDGALFAATVENLEGKPHVAFSRISPVDSRSGTAATERGRGADVPSRDAAPAGTVSTNRAP